MLTISLHFAGADRSMGADSAIATGMVPPLGEKEAVFMDVLFVRFSMPSIGPGLLAGGEESKTSPWGYCITHKRLRLLTLRRRRREVMICSFGGSTNGR